jgi:hypothetical protein
MQCIRLMLLLAATLFCCTSLFAKGREIPAPVQTKFDAIAAEIDKAEKAGALDENEAHQARSSLGDVQRLYGQGSTFETVLSHARHTGTIAKTPELRGVWKDAVSALEVEAKTAMEAQKKLFDSREQLFQRAAEACTRAQKPEDLDAVLKELQDASSDAVPSRSQTEFPGLAQQHTQLVQAMNFVANWKQMLADAATGDDPGAITRLKTMMRSTSGRIAQQIPTPVLEGRLKELQDKRAARLDEILKTVARDLPATKSAKDAQGIADRLRVVRDEETSRRSDAVGKAAEVAQTWADMLRAEEAGEWGTAYGKLSELSATRGRNDAHLIPAEAMESKRKTLWSHLSEKSEAALVSLPTDLQKVGSSAAARDLAAKLQTFSQDLSAQGSSGMRGEPEFSLLANRLNRAAATATAWGTILEAKEENRAMDGLKAITTLGRTGEQESDASVLPSGLLAMTRKYFLQQLLVGSPAQMSDGDADLHQAIARGVAALGKPEDAVALVEVTRRIAPALDSSEGEDLHNLARDLTSLAAEWNGAAIESQAPANPWSSETQTIRNRLRREQLARQMALPEINAAPLANQPTEVALDKLAEDCAKHGDWRRVLDCLTASRQLLAFARDQRGARGETLGREIQAVSDYLAGGNFERAEQFAEAVHAYQNVLRQPGTYVPTAEATERLRALKADHKELFSVPPGRDSGQ